MRTRRRLAATLIVAGALAAACNFTLDGYQGDPLVPETGADDTSTIPNDAPTDTALQDAADTSTGADAGCPSGRGPTMVRITDSASFCIDSTEVTNSQYQAFLLSGATPTNTSPPPVCAFNDTYSAGSGSTVDDPTKTNYPVTVVNWCDAYAFCQWAGKRLCGKVGGGHSSAAEFGTTKNEFYFACSHGGAQAYNYSGPYNSMACNATGDKSIEPVANRATCEGGYPGIYDLVGNLGEWQDDCDTQIDGKDHCVDNSTSFIYTSGALDTVQRCDHYDDQIRSQAYLDLGFRCCAD